jgi:hypothetical protein
MGIKDNFRGSKPLFLTAALAWFLVVCLCGVVARMGFLQIPLLRLYQVGLVIVLIAVSFGIGRFILRLLKHDTAFDPLGALYSIGVGFGVLAYVVLFLGLCGILNRWVYVCIFAAVFLLTYKDIAGLLKYITTTTRQEHRFDIFKVILIVLIGSAALINMFGAFAPEYEYDSLEYHLGTGWTYLKDARIHFLPNNVFSNFPSLMEMLYLLGMLLEGQTVAKLLNFSIGLLILFTIYAAGRRFPTASGSLVACAIFYVYAQVGLLSSHAFIDLGVTFYSLLAVLAAVDYILAVTGGQHTRNNGNTSPGVLLTTSAITSGLAVSCKYPSVLLSTAVIICVVLIASGLQRFKPVHLRAIVVFGIVVLFIPLPWFAKNYIYTRNPVYPLMYKLFHSRNWDEVKDTRFELAHTARDRSLKTLLTTPWQMFVENNTATPLAIIFLPLLVFIPGVERFMKWLLIYCGLFYLFWFYFTHRIDRFLVPVLPALAIIGGYTYMKICDSRVIPAWLRTGATLIVVFGLAFNLYLCWGMEMAIEPVSVALGLEDEESFLGKHLPVYNAFKYVNENLDDNSVTLYTGEARVMYVKRNVIANTVFDTNIVSEIVNNSKSREDILSKMKSRGITHVLINYPEIKRLSGTYLNYMDDFNWPLFNAFIYDRLTEVYSDSPHGIFIYRINYPGV